MSLRTNSPKAIIWDFDGTIIDSLGVMQGVLAEVLPKYGYEVPSDEIMAKNFHGTLHDSISTALGGVEPAIMKTILEEFLLRQSLYYEDAERHFLADSVGLVGRASRAGLTQIIVTNRDHIGRELASPRSIVERSRLGSSFTRVIAGDDSSYRKPDPAVLGTFLNEYKLAPEDLLVIGDQFVDAEFALNLGAQAIIVDRAGAGLHYAERLPAGWHDAVTIMPSLDAVILN